jgi:hypothetical protein
LAKHVEPPPSRHVSEAAEADQEGGEGEVIARQHPLHGLQVGLELPHHGDHEDGEDAAVEDGE